MQEIDAPTFVSEIRSGIETSRKNIDSLKFDRFICPTLKWYKRTKKHGQALAIDVNHCLMVHSKQTTVRFQASVFIIVSHRSFHFILTVVEIHNEYFSAPIENRGKNLEATQISAKFARLPNVSIMEAPFSHVFVIYCIVERLPLELKTTACRFKLYTQNDG